MSSSSLMINTLAAPASRDLPPQLVDTSFVRIFSGYLSAAQVKGLITRDCIRVILFASSVAGWTGFPVSARGSLKTTRWSRVLRMVPPSSCESRANVVGLFHPANVPSPWLTIDRRKHRSLSGHCTSSMPHKPSRGGRAKSPDATPLPALSLDNFA
jgi:hypothetical protein